MFERDSLAAYGLAMFPRLDVAEHHLKIIGALRRVEQGKCKRLLITAPPRHSKSLFVSEFFPAWALGRKPSRQIICATYGQELSTTFGRRVKAQILDDRYRQIFPGCRPMGDSTSADLIDTTERGRYVATSIGGSVTGKGADILIIDDPIKDRAEAESATMREKMWDWYTSVARTRLQPGGAIAITQTRWHEDDLTGRILAKQPGEWEHLHLSAISDDRKALWPEWFPMEDLLAIKREIGSYDFEALYQGRPQQRGGGMLKLANVGRYEPQDAPPMQRLILAIDTAAKTKEMNDYSVIALMGLAGNGVYVLNIWRQRVEYPGLKAGIKSQYETFHPEMICIEDSSAGVAVIQELRTDTILPIKAVPAVADKVTRATPLSAGIECGRLMLPTRAPWLADLEAEIAGFPTMKHDDQIDALAIGYKELHMVPPAANIRNPMFARKKT